MSIETEVKKLTLAIARIAEYIEAYHPELKDTGVAAAQPAAAQPVAEQLTPTPQPVAAIPAQQAIPQQAAVPAAAVQTEVQPQPV